MSFLGGIGSALLGGLFGSSAKKKELAYQREFAQHGIRWRVADAKAAGIHPLAALGSPGAQYQPSNATPWADAARSIGEQLQQRTQGKTDKALAAKQGELLDAQVAEARSRTLLNETNALRAMPRPGVAVRRPASQDDPYEMRQENALIKVRLENGEVITMPNPDVYEIGPAELVTGRGIIEGARQVDRAKKRAAKVAPRQVKRRGGHATSSAPSSSSSPGSRSRAQRRKRN